MQMLAINFSKCYHKRMDTHEHYTRPPITEALIDIRVQLPQSFALEDLARVGAEQSDYPKKSRRGEVQWEVSIGSSLSTSATNTPLGFVFSSEDGHRAFQARLDGFTFSWSGHYKSWIDLSTEAKRLWSIYREITQPAAITRIAVRYINKLNLPLPLRDLKDYLRTLPELSSEIPQALSAYFMQLQIPQEDLQSLLIINQALLPPDNERVLSVLLDIDLFREDNIPEDEEAIWDLFEQFRWRKNAVFNACITSNMKELIR